MRCTKSPPAPRRAVRGRWTHDRVLGHPDSVVKLLPFPSYVCRAHSTGALRSGDKAPPLHTVGDVPAAPASSVLAPTELPLFAPPAGSRCVPTQAWHTAGAHRLRAGRVLKDSGVRRALECLLIREVGSAPPPAQRPGVRGRCTGTQEAASSTKYRRRLSTRRTPVGAAQAFTRGRLAGHRHAAHRSCQQGGPRKRPHPR